jgi:lipopolysaccharide/colanic/teichoic acid biosynthesis glycosyltransferase
VVGRIVCQIAPEGVRNVRRLALLSIDLLLVALATVIAVALRASFETVSNALIFSLPYIFLSVGCACVVFLLAGMDRSLWRYSSVADHLQVVVLTVLAILIALGLTFAMNRLEPVARSLPVVQGALSITILIFARSAVRFWHARQTHIINSASSQPRETVLVMGVNTLTELYLQSVKEFASQYVRVAGILCEEPDMRSRTIQQKPVLGTVEELQNILQSLEVHGVAVDRIVVVTAADRLRPHSLAVLLEIEKSSNIAVEFLSERLGFDDSSSRRLIPSGQERVPDQSAAARSGSVIDLDHANSIGKFFRFTKRAVDIFGATLLIFTLMPVAALVAVIVALDVGFPVIFWQQRPGLYGRPFKLYKFRTMRAPHDNLWRRIPDDQRSSAIGQLLRRLRLDELPQLFNVLVGDMSLIGPRPLLPCDQSPEYAARLFVRPGITGWAQVNGGKIISTPDKLILDIWYVQNASWVLDVAIVFHTVNIILFGDRINIEAVNEARRDLGLKASLRTTMVPAE